MNRTVSGGPVSTRKVDPNDAPFLGAIVESAREIVGVQNAALYHKTATSATGDLTQTTTFGEGAWDEISADSVRIELTNSTGGARVLTDVVVRGMPVHRLQSLKYDRVIDYEDIARVGERVATFGSGDVVNTTQLNKLGDHAAKVNGVRRHVYVVSVVGTRYDYRSGRWYRLQIGGSGESEYIDSVCECLYVQTSRSARGGPSTRIGFREVYEAWKFDSGAFARYRASGDIRALVGSGHDVTIAASTWTLKADYWCDGTADQTDINLAITNMAAKGGGIVRLTRGTYILSAAIETKSNVELVGAGVGATIIEKNCNDYAIHMDGSSGTPLAGITLRGFTVTRNASDTNASQHLVYGTYCTDLLIERLEVSDSYAHGIYIENCTNPTITNTTVADCDSDGATAIVVSICTGAVVSGVAIDCACNAGLSVLVSGNDSQISDVRIKGMRSSSATLAVGLNYTFSSTGEVTNVAISDIEQSGAGNAVGAAIGNDKVNISNIRIDDITNTDTAANSVGLLISGSDITVTSFLVTNVDGTGVQVDTGKSKNQLSGGRSTSNGTNYTDNGTSTGIAAFDST